MLNLRECFKCSSHLHKITHYYCLKMEYGWNIWLKVSYTIYHCVWGPGNHSMLPPGCRPPILKPKLYKESKNGFKPINYCSPLISDFFQKTVFGTKKSSKKWTFLLIFEFLSQHIWIRWTSFKKFHFRTFKISWNITKMLKTKQFFNEYFLIFENQVFQV